MKGFGKFVKLSVSYYLVYYVFAVALAVLMAFFEAGYIGDGAVQQPDYAAILSGNPEVVQEGICYAEHVIQAFSDVDIVFYGFLIFLLVGIALGRQFLYHTGRTKEFFLSLPVKKHVLPLTDYILTLGIGVAVYLSYIAVFLVKQTGENRRLLDMAGITDTAVIGKTNLRLLAITGIAFLFVAMYFTWLYLGMQLAKHPLVGVGIVTGIYCVGAWMAGGLGFETEERFYRLFFLDTFYQNADWNVGLQLFVLAAGFALLLLTSIRKEESGGSHVHAKKSLEEESRQKKPFLSETAKAYMRLLWKPYVIGGVLAALVLAKYLMDNAADIFWLYMDGETNGMAHMAGERRLISGQLSVYRDAFLNVMLLVLLVCKYMTFRIERTAGGRAFLEMLPVRRYQKQLIRLLKDVGLVLGTAALMLAIYWFGIGRYVPYTDAYVMGSFAFCAVCHMLLLVAVINLADAVCISDFHKLGALASTAFLAIAADTIPYRINNTYGLSDMFVDGIYAVLYGRVPSSYQDVGEEPFSFVNMMQEKGAAYYAWGVAFLCAAIILGVCAVRLAGRREASKEVFYFAGVKYVVALLPAVCFGSLIGVASDALYCKALGVAVFAVVYLLTLYLFKPDRKYMRL